MPEFSVASGSPHLSPAVVRLCPFTTFHFGSPLGRSDDVVPILPRHLRIRHRPNTGFFFLIRGFAVHHHSRPPTACSSGYAFMPASSEPHSFLLWPFHTLLPLPFSTSPFLSPPSYYPTSCPVSRDPPFFPPESFFPTQGSVQMSGYFSSNSSLLKFGDAVFHFFLYGGFFSSSVVCSLRMPLKEPATRFSKRVKLPNPVVSTLIFILFGLSLLRPVRIPRFF